MTLLDEHIARAFGVERTAILLTGGEGRTYQVGEIILRQEQDRAEAIYFAELFNAIEEEGFHVPRPVLSITGEWLTQDGWSAWKFVAGRPAEPEDIPQVVPALEAFHRALAKFPYPPHLATRNSRYDWADQAAWDELPVEIAVRLAEPLGKLIKHKKPIAHVHEQLIHGDLNPDNILVEPGLPPAIIDIAPYWRPSQFALAVTAYWMGGYHNNPAILPHFAHLQNFDQMLIRAAIRMLLLTQAFNTTDNLYQHEQAVRVICEWLERKA